MSAANLCPILQENQWTDNAQFLAGGLMWFYAGGTTTPLTVYTDSTALTAWPNPIQLNARGETGGEIWLAGGQYYKIVLESAPLSGQTHGVTISTYDNISGINDATLLLLTGDWEAFGGTPTFLSASSFSVSGDNRATLQVNRRLKLSCAAGLQYGTISASTFNGSVTTITLRMDAANDLDSGLSSFQYGLIQTNPSSIPVAVQTGTTTEGSNHEIYLDWDGTNLLLGIDNTEYGSTWPISQFASGTRVPFAQATAPTGWVQDTSDAANNRMLRVVNDGTGNAVAGSSDPTIMNVVPAHTHNYSGTTTAVGTGTYIADPGHAHGVSDPGHRHNFTYAGTPGGGTATGAYFGGNPATIGTWVQPAATGISINVAGTGVSIVDPGHAHGFGGSTDNGSSQTNWTPRYINLIICQKS